MFSVCSLTLVANLAMVATASSVNVELEAFGFEQRDCIA